MCIIYVHIKNKQTLLNNPLQNAILKLPPPPSDMPSSLGATLSIIVDRSGGNEHKPWEKSLSFPVHPGRLTWTIMMEVWKIIFLSKWVICRFHVNLPGCKYHQKWWLVHDYVSLQVCISTYIWLIFIVNVGRYIIYWIYWVSGNVCCVGCLNCYEYFKRNMLSECWWEGFWGEKGAIIIQKTHVSLNM